MNPNFHPKPSLCISSKSNEKEDEFEEILCNLNGLDQKGERKFKSFLIGRKKV